MTKAVKVSDDPWTDGLLLDERNVVLSPLLLKTSWPMMSLAEVLKVESPE